MKALADWRQNTLQEQRWCVAAAKNSGVAWNSRSLVQHQYPKGGGVGMMPLSPDADRTQTCFLLTETRAHSFAI